MVVGAAAVHVQLQVWARSTTSRGAAIMAILPDPVNSMQRPRPKTALATTRQLIRRWREAVREVYGLKSPPSPTAPRVDILIRLSRDLISRTSELVRTTERRSGTSSST